MGNRIVTVILGLLMMAGLQAQISKQSIGTTSNRVVVRNQLQADSAIGMPNVKTTTNLMNGQFAYNSLIRTFEFYDTLTARWYPLSVLQDGLISGGVVSWTGTGLNFYVSEANYIIGGVLYNSSDTTVTLSAADPDSARLDVIALNSSGVLVLTGTPAEDPAKPQVTPGSELELTSVLINAGATTPGNVSQYIIWDENTESVFTTNGTGNADNTDNPFHLTKAVDFNSHGAATILTFTLPSGITLTDYSVLVFYIRLKSTYPSNTRLNIEWLKPLGLVFPEFYVSSNVSIGTGQYGFNRTVTGAYQTIQVPMSAFTFTETPSGVNKFRIFLTGAGPGFYLDYIQLQSGVTVSGIGVNSFNGRTGNVTPIKADYAQWFLDTTYRRGDSVFGVKNGVELFQFIDGGGGGSSYTFTNGLTESGAVVKLGGTLTENTAIAGDNRTFDMTGLQSGEISAETIGGITSRLRVTPLADAGSLSTVNFTTGISSVTTSSTSGVNMSTTSYVSSKTSTIAALPDSIRFETPDGRFSIPFLELGTDTINWKPTVWNPSTKRFARLGSWPAAGSTSLNNVGTGFDLAQQGTANVKRLAGGFGIIPDSTTTANTVTLRADSSKLATVTSVRDTAQVLRGLISADGTTYGTYAQRIALTGSVQPGHRFYQTNERIGLWIYGMDNKWEHQPPAGNMLFRMSNELFQYGFLTFVSGAGSASSGVQDNTLADTLNPFVYRITTGTATNGYATAFSYNLNNQGSPPIDTPAISSRYVLTFRAKLFADLTEAQNTVIHFGWRNSSTPNNDSTNYGHYFRMSWHENANIMLYTQDNGGSGDDVDASSVSIASLVGRYVDYTIVFSNRRCDWYIDGTLVGSTILTSTSPSSQYIQQSSVGIGVRKLAGTTPTVVAFSRIYGYQTFKQL